LREWASEYAALYPGLERDLNCSVDDIVRFWRGHLADESQQKPPRTGRRREHGRREAYKGLRERWTTGDRERVGGSFYDYAAHALRTSPEGLRRWAQRNGLTG